LKFFELRGQLIFGLTYFVTSRSNEQSSKSDRDNILNQGSRNCTNSLNRSYLHRLTTLGINQCTYNTQERSNDSKTAVCSRAQPSHPTTKNPSNQCRGTGTRGNLWQQIGN
ncbi:MAG: hypothetical protein ACM37W_00060, partial [Actinomycetota bacterium]